jgi:serine/threonine-protein kinase
MNVDLANCWTTLKPMLEALLDAPAAQRAELLDRFAANDAVLRATLERLLVSEDATDDVVSRSFDPARLAETIARHVDDADTWIGRTLGAYRLTRTIGSGGMGTVFVAEREGGGFGQKVAVKVFKASGISDSLRARFQRERQILATLRHPNIAALFDGGDTEEGLPWYAMELVDGVDIAEHFRTKANDIPARVRLLLDVAAALSYAHQHLVVHRDIKPSNILVSAEGRVKLLDFGIAKLLGSDAGAAGVTEAALGPMTPEYAAPEQFRGDAVTVATDVFQFGTLAYRLLTGHFPYDADPADRYAWSRAVNENDPKSLTWAIARGGDATWGGGANVARIRRTLRGDLGAILAMALAKAPGDRYRSMDAMIGDLEAWLDGRPVVARGHGAAYQAWRFLSRRPWVSGGAAVALVAIVVAGIVAMYQARRAEKEAASVLAVTTSLIGLMRQADPDVNGSAQLDAKMLVEQTIASVEKDLAAQPLPRARLLATAGADFLNLGELARSEDAYRRALDAFGEAGAAKTTASDNVLIALAWIKYRENDADGSLRLLDEAKRNLDGDTSVAAKNALSIVWDYRGLIHGEAGDFVRSRHDFDQSIALAIAHNDAAIVRRNAVVALKALDDYDAAINEVQRSVDAFRARYGDDHSRTAGSQITLASLLIDIGDIARATAIAATIEPQYKKHFDGANIELPLAETMFGNLARANRRYDEAIRHYEAAEAAYVAKVGDTHPYRATPIYEAGLAEAARGDDAAALRAFDRALAIRERGLAPSHPDTAQVLDARALALARLCRLDDARADAERALEIRRAKLPYAHSATVDSLRHVALLRIATGESGGAELLADAHERAATATFYRKIPALMQALEAEIADPDAEAKRMACVK